MDLWTLVETSRRVSQTTRRLEKISLLAELLRGLTDAMLDWQIKRLLELEVSRDQWAVYVRPELVVEMAFNNMQSSPHYPAGMALRFARVKRYRPDKSPAETDTLETVRRLKN